jgi:chromate transporter
MQRPRWFEIGWLFLRVGNTTFGGGDPTMAVLQREMVNRLGWITGEQFGLCYSLARLTPGTNVLAFCAAAAWLAGGWVGAAVAVLAACVPSAVLAVWLVHAYEALSSHPTVQGAVGGMVAAVVGMMLAGVLLLFRGQMKRAGVPRAVLLAGGSASLVGVLEWNPLVVLGLAAGAGALGGEPT